MRNLILDNTTVTETTLSQRESEILQLMSIGCNSREIADKLFISELTVQTHRKNMLRKMGCRNFYPMLCWGIKQGIIVL